MNKKHVLEYEIECLSEISLSASNQSIGTLDSLDFIPGRTIWGLVANRAYQSGMTEQEAFRLFHQGAIGFRDAVLLQDGVRAYPIPRSWHVPKNRPSKEIFGGIPASDEQFKPYGEGWLTAERVPVAIERNYAMRTSIDRSGKARDGLLYGIPTIQAGTRFTGAIIGTQADVEQAWYFLKNQELTLGRSKNSEMGLVRFTQRTGASPSLGSNLAGSSRQIDFYCVSRCVLRSDETGAPTYLPAPSAFGLDDDWTFDETGSFIRVVKIVHFNGARRRPESERFAIERGSVIRFKTERGTLDTQRIQGVLDWGVGDFTEQGYGEVLCNPAWLAEGPFQLGTATSVAKPVKEPQDELFQWVRARVKQAKARDEAFERAQQEAQTLGRFRITPAQWGTLRHMARGARVRQHSPEAFQLALEAHLGSGRRKLDQEWTSSVKAKILAIAAEEDGPAKVEQLAAACARASAQEKGGVE